MRAKPIDSNLKIGLVGYGEVGKILARALRDQGLAWVGAWDVLFSDPAQGVAMKGRAREDRVEACSSLAALLARADIVISAATAANALEVASEAVRSVRPGTFFSTSIPPLP
jgi:3-hydroxyisobutyrate dehydrogenase